MSVSITAANHKEADLLPYLYVQKDERDTIAGPNSRKCNRLFEVFGTSGGCTYLITSSAMDIRLVPGYI